VDELRIDVAEVVNLVAQQSMEEARLVLHGWGVKGRALGEHPQTARLISCRCRPTDVVSNQPRKQ
jgi:hypothetical protein